MGRQEQCQGHDRPHSAPEPGQQDRGRDRHAVGPRHRPARGVRHREVRARADRRAGPGRQARQEVRRLDAARQELFRGQGTLPFDPRLLHRLPRPVSQGSVDRDREHAQWPGHLARPAGRWPEAEGQGLPDRHRAGAPQRLPQLVARDPVVLRRLRGGQGRQDADLQLQGDARDPQVPQGALQGDDDARGARLGRRLQQPSAGLRARLVDPQSDQRLPDDRGAEQGAGGQDLHPALAARVRPAGCPTPTAWPTASPSSRRTRTWPSSTWKI